MREIITMTRGQLLFQRQLARATQALQVRGFQHAQGIGAVLFNAPAELLLHHETVEQHDIRGQFANKVVETAVIQFDGAFGDPECRQVGLVLANGGRAAEGNVPTLRKKALKDLHHMPARCRGAGLGPDVANDQDFGGGLIHRRRFP